MHGTLRGIAIGLLLTLGAAVAGGGTIAFVEAERAVATVKEGQAMLRQMEEWAKPREREIESMRQRLAELQGQIVSQRSVASSDALERLRQEELDHRRRLEDATRELRREFEAKQDELLRPVAEKLNQVVSEYAEANGLEAVLIFKPRTIIYLSDEADITDEVIALYDERYPSP